MLKNTLICGTASNLISHLGTNTQHLDSHCFHHVISPDSSKKKNVAHLSQHSAKLVYGYAKSEFKQLSTVLICLRIPDITSFDNLSSKQALDSVFNTELFFTLDLLRQSINLIELFNPKPDTIHSLAKSQKKSKCKIFITIPFVRKQLLNNAQLVYYNSICAALHSFVAGMRTPTEIAIIYTQLDSNVIENADSILALVDSLQHKPTRNKTFYQDSWFDRHISWRLPWLAHK